MGWISSRPLLRSSRGRGDSVEKWGSGWGDLRCALRSRMHPQTSTASCVYLCEEGQHAFAMKRLDKHDGFGLASGRRRFFGRRTSLATLVPKDERLAGNVWGCPSSLFNRPTEVVQLPHVATAPHLLCRRVSSDERSTIPS